MDWNSWDGEGYRITIPYAEKERIGQPDRNGPDSIQFRHHMGDIFNGLLDVGLSIQQVQDAPHYFQQSADERPGSWDHWLTYVGGFAIVARKA